MFFNRKLKQQIVALQDENVDLRKQYEIVLQLLHLRQDDVIHLERQLANIPSVMPVTLTFYDSIRSSVKDVLYDEAGIVRDSAILRIADRITGIVERDFKVLSGSDEDDNDDDDD